MLKVLVAVIEELVVLETVWLEEYVELSSMVSEAFAASVLLVVKFSIRRVVSVVLKEVNVAVVVGKLMEIGSFTQTTRQFIAGSQLSPIPVGLRTSEAEVGLSMLRFRLICRHPSGSSGRSMTTTHALGRSPLQRESKSRISSAPSIQLTTSTIG